VAQRDTYGFDPTATWRASEYEPLQGGGARFTLHTTGRSFPARTPLVGAHNVRNALASIAVADYFGVGIVSALASLDTFLGTRRRFETRGHPRSVWVVDDYAHHPTAVAATLLAARETRPEGDVWVVFQPHTTHRTAALFDGFVRAFSEADHVMLLPIYVPAGREPHPAEVTSADLAAAIRRSGHADVQACASADAALGTLLERLHPGDLILTMGAGDVTRLADRLVEGLA
jgi:UDP-N-acetylmuramate--alanine ligase